MKKSIIFILVCLLLFSSTVYANENANAEKILFTYDKVFPPTEGLVVVEKDKKCGVIDTSNNLIVPFKYDEIWGFIDGVSIVELDNCYGVIDSNGNEIIACIYDEIHITAENDISSKLIAVCKDNKWGFIDRSGNIVVDLEYKYTGLAAYSVEDGMIKVEKDGKYGYVNGINNTIIECVYETASYFSDGLARVQKNDKWGYIDKSGKLVIPYLYDDANNFSEGLAAVCKDDKWGFIDKKNNIKIPFEYLDAGEFTEGLANVVVDGKYRWGFINKSNELVIPAKYYRSGANGFKNGIVHMYKTEYWNFTIVDNTGKEIIDGLTSGGDYVNGLCPVGRYDESAKKEKRGYIDEKGNVIIPFIYDDAGNFSEGLAVVSVDGKYGYIDETGKVKIPLKYDFANDFENGTASVQIGHSYGYVDINGNEIVPVKYTYSEAMTILQNIKYNYIRVSDKYIVMQIDNPIMNANGEAKAIDIGIGTTPVIVDGRTLVPIRAIIEEIGGRVEWQESTSTVILTYNDDEIKLTIGSNLAYKNDVSKTLDVAPQVMNGRTMLPIRFVVENFGFIVDWHNDEQQVTILY